MGLSDPWNLVMVGAGNLGSALVTYREFKDRGFSIVGVFDNDLTKIGKRIADMEVLPLEELSRVVKEHNVRIGIIAVPSKAAQDIADIMVKAGLEALLNFAPISLNLPDDAEVRMYIFQSNSEI